MKHAFLNEKNDALIYTGNRYNNSTFIRTLFRLILFAHCIHVAVHSSHPTVPSLPSLPTIPSFSSPPQFAFQLCFVYWSCNTASYASFQTPASPSLPPQVCLPRSASPLPASPASASPASASPTHASPASASPTSFLSSSLDFLPPQPPHPYFKIIVFIPNQPSVLPSPSLTSPPLCIFFPNPLHRLQYKGVSKSDNPLFKVLLTK